jgi:RNA-directed DNA polymerase
MPQDAPPNGGAPPGRVVGPYGRVTEMQAKLHRWAAADPGRRFDDLFNFVHDPATLLMAFARVAGNRGANTPVSTAGPSPWWRSILGCRGSWTACGPR